MVIQRKILRIFLYYCFYIQQLWLLCVQSIDTFQKLISRCLVIDISRIKFNPCNASWYTQKNSLCDVRFYVDIVRYYKNVTWHLLIFRLPKSLCPSCLYSMYMAIWSARNSGQKFLNTKSIFNNVMFNAL